MGMKWDWRKCNARSVYSRDAWESLWRVRLGWFECVQVALPWWLEEQSDLWGYSWVVEVEERERKKESPTVVPVDLWERKTACARPTEIYRTPRRFFSRRSSNILRADKWTSYSQKYHFRSYVNHSSQRGFSELIVCTSRTRWWRLELSSWTQSFINFNIWWLRNFPNQDCWSGRLGHQRLSCLASDVKGSGYSHSDWFRLSSSRFMKVSWVMGHAPFTWKAWFLPSHLRLRYTTVYAIICGPKVTWDKERASCPATYSDQFRYGRKFTTHSVIVCITRDREIRMQPMFCSRTPDWRT